MDFIPEAPHTFTEKDLFVRVLPSEELGQLISSPDGELRLQDKIPFLPLEKSPKSFRLFQKVSNQSTVMKRIKKLANNEFNHTKIILKRVKSLPKQSSEVGIKILSEEITRLENLKSNLKGMPFNSLKTYSEKESSELEKTRLIKKN